MCISELIPHGHLVCTSTDGAGRILSTLAKPMSKITQSARNESCTINLIGVCNYNPDSVVWAHSNKGIHGKGLGLKAKDENGAYACYQCHMTYDRQIKRPKNLSLEDVEAAFTIAMLKSQQILKDKGLI